MRRLVVSCVVALASVSGAQVVPIANARVAGALEIIRRDNAWTLEQQRSICEIPAPPFREAARAAEVKHRFEALGYTGVRIDAVGNVIATHAGTSAGPGVVIEGHLDTVFPEGTDVKVHASAMRMSSPGISDDCRGLAVVLAAARAFQLAKVAHPGTLWFIANVGEEGPGNLRGTRHLFERELKGKIDQFISVDGSSFDVTNRAVGSHRYRIVFKGPGGHSYGAFGIPNPIHAMGRAIADIADIQVPVTPKVTFNVGVVKGGTSVNSIPFEGSMELDMRSESAVELDRIDAKARKIVADAIVAENARWAKSGEKVSATFDTIGIRPTGAQAEDAPIVKAALAAGAALGIRSELGASSTDANIPIAMGLPGITIGGGGNAGGEHALSEYYEETPDAYKAAQWAVLLVAILLGVRP
ncbi:MAG: peptidase [Gemmatimonadetes bacterium]|nr:peptidase [Gemmatimonadota bacterium]